MLAVFSLFFGLTLLLIIWVRLTRVKQLGHNESKIFSKEFNGEQAGSNPLGVLTKGEIIENLRNTTTFFYRHRIPNELLLRAQCKTLIAVATRLTPCTFRKILETWHSDELSIGNWILGYAPNDIFKFIRVIESFIPFADRFVFDHVGVLPPKRPLLFFRGVTNYWILRKDGTLLNCLFIVKDEPTFISFAGGKEFERKVYEVSFPHALDKKAYFKTQ